MSYPPPPKLLAEAAEMSEKALRAAEVQKKQEELIAKNKEAAKDALLSIQLLLDRRPLRYKY